LREEIEMVNQSGKVSRKFLFFSEYGTEDDRINIDLGREMKSAWNLLVVIFRWWRIKAWTIGTPLRC
jgi:hypothetical protein